LDSVLNHARLSHDRSLQTRLGKAAPKNLGGYFPEFTTFVNSTQFHLTHEVFGQIQRRFHASNFPAFQLSGKGRQAKDENLTRRRVEKTNWQHVRIRMPFGTPFA
jgi:hypothetical protein